jgi:hypothetical protein
VGDQGAHLFEGEDPFGALVVVAWSFAALELAERVDGDATFTGGLGEDDRQGSQGAGDRPALELFVEHVRDEGGNVFGVDLVEAAPAEVGDQVLVERPGVELERARTHGLPFEPLACVPLEGLAAGFGAFAAAAAQPQLGTARLSLLE